MEKKTNKSGTEIWKYQLYNGEVEIDFYPNSHRYKIVRVEGLSDDEVKKLNETKSSGTSAPGIIDKSRQLVIWATREYTKKVKELMEGGSNFTYDDVLSMLEEGEKAHSIKKKSAGDVGSVVHRVAELFVVEAIQGEKIKFNEETWTYEFDENIITDFRNQAIEEVYGGSDITEDELQKITSGITAFLNWLNEYHPKLLEAEQLVYSRKNNHLGLFDILFELNEKFLPEDKKDLAGKWIGDYKTSNGIYDEHEFQGSSYLFAKEEETGEKYSGVMILAFYKQDKENSEGIIVKPAGSLEVKVVGRKQNISNYVIYKHASKIEQEKKRRAKEWRENQKKLSN